MQTEPFKDRLTEICRRWDLLRHPFYQAWIAGTLSLAELRDYTAQYAHIVKAIPAWLNETARYHPSHASNIQKHSAEESDHVALWNSFASALDLDPGTIELQKPNAATAKLLSIGEQSARQGYGAAAVWALEAQAPAVSAEKLSGLEAHYGIDRHSGAEYFALHADLDKEHEQQLRTIMIEGEEPARRQAIEVASQTSAALWDLLTSVHHPGLVSENSR